MAVKTRSYKYLANDKWHLYQTHKLSTIFGSEFKYCRFCRSIMNDDLVVLMQNGFDLPYLLDQKTKIQADLNKANSVGAAKLVNQCKSKMKPIKADLDKAKHVLSESNIPKFVFPLLCTIVRRKGVIGLVINGHYTFYEIKGLVPVLHSHSHSKENIKMITTGISSDPVQQINNASKRVKILADSLNFGLDVARYFGYRNIHMYMMTLTVPNVDLGQLTPALRGEASQSHGHYHGGLKGKVNSLRKWIDRHYQGSLINLGGFQDFETTTNHERLVHSCSKGLFHPHTHMLLVMSGTLTGRFTYDHVPMDSDLKALKFLSSDENRIWNEWNKLNNGYWSEDLNRQAFDLEPIYSGGADDDNAVERAISEASKYVVKPDFYQRLDDSSNGFQQRVFAELLNATYRFHAKTSYGLLRRATTALNSFGAFRSATTSAMDMDPRYNAGHAPQLPDILTWISYAHVNKNSKYHSKYLQINKGRKLTLKQLLYYNRNLIAGSAITDKQQATLDQLSKSDSLSGYVARFPYLTANSFIDSVREIALKYQDKANREHFKGYYNYLHCTGSKERHAYQCMRAYRSNYDKYLDLIQLYRALQKYTMPNGLVHLGYKINPTFSLALGKWTGAFLSKLDQSNLRVQGWRYYAHDSTGCRYKLTSKQINIVKHALACANDLFKGVGAPTPANDPDPDKPGHYLAFNNDYNVVHHTGRTHSVGSYNYKDLVPKMYEDDEHLLHDGLRESYDNWYDPSGYGFDFKLTSDESTKNLKKSFSKINNLFKDYAQ